MGRARMVSRRRHVLRLTILSAGFLVMLLASRGTLFTLGSSLGWLIITLGNPATLPKANRGEGLRRPVRPLEAALVVLLAGGTIPLLIWLRRRGADEWLKPAEAVLRHPAYILSLWALFVGAEVWVWRRLSRTAPNSDAAATP
ncbi:MAG: hypothetical protein JWO31_2136 [Phycisphaerales bacterium]|nr:hypothetical protein [Phycisphaerales bacterium]